MKVLVKIEGYLEVGEDGLRVRRVNTNCLFDELKDDGQDVEITIYPTDED